MGWLKETIAPEITAAEEALKALSKKLAAEPKESWRASLAHEVVEDMHSNFVQRVFDLYHIEDRQHAPPPSNTGATRWLLTTAFRSSWSSSTRSWGPGHRLRPFFTSGPRPPVDNLLKCPPGGPIHHAISGVSTSRWRPCRTTTRSHCGLPKNPHSLLLSFNSRNARMKVARASRSMLASGRRWRQPLRSL
jgi:hypothetical protein